MRAMPWQISLTVLKDIKKDNGLKRIRQTRIFFFRDHF